MKKIILFAFTALVLTACSKEYSFENTAKPKCPTVIAKHAQLHLLIQSATGLEFTEVAVSASVYNSIQIGDQYCQ